MKDFYRIKEISQLFDIGPDSLRYYEEIGILRPRRGSNGYRLYGMNDIYRLNVIKDLRQIGFSMQRIKEYLDSKTLANTVQLLREEERAIANELARLRATKKAINTRISEIMGYGSEKIGVIESIRCPARFCVRLNAEVRRDEEVDFALSRLHRRFEHKLYSISNYMIGATQNVSDIRAGTRGLFHSVFIITGTGEMDKESKESKKGKKSQKGQTGGEECDFILPEGDYLSLHYRGSYQKSPDRIDDLLKYADERGYETRGEVLELYKIDVHETNDASEFLTELQIMIAAATENG